MCKYWGSKKIFNQIIKIRNFCMQWLYNNDNYDWLDWRSSFIFYKKSHQLKQFILKQKKRAAVDCASVNWNLSLKLSKNAHKWNHDHSLWCQIYECLSKWKFLLMSSNMRPFSKAMIKRNCFFCVFVDFESQC